MPKVEIDRELLKSKLKFNLKESEFQEILESIKGELDGFSSDGNSYKIEFNDTNRPDLWTYTGLARALNNLKGFKTLDYNFFSSKDSIKRESGVILVDYNIKDIRPFIFGFLARGKLKSDEELNSLISLQEKLTQNYGQKRKRVAMGIYSASKFNFPLTYKAVNKTYEFIPLDFKESLSLEKINLKHPKGREYSNILKDFNEYPIILDNVGKTLSYPPIINSNDIGSVKVGDDYFFIELTGTHLEAVLLSTAIVACDFYDMGFEILPVKTIYPFDTKYGREITSPFYFQETINLNLDSISKVLGENFSLDEIKLALNKLGVNLSLSDKNYYVKPPEYRNDFMHEVDIIEDIMIGVGLDSFKRELPSFFTLGCLSPIESFSRKVKEIMIGMGFQEMIYNYLGSKKDFVDKMGIRDDFFVKIANPMTENYEYLRASILPSLFKSEALSSNALYPHKIFEIGKVAFKNELGEILTKDYFSALVAQKTIGFNDINSYISTLFYYLNLNFSIKESSDNVFIEGRRADIFLKTQKLGTFGEVNPTVLDNFGIIYPCVALELDLNTILDNI